MNIRPLHDHIIVRPIEEGRQRLGVLIPDAANETRPANKKRSDDQDVHKGAMEDERPSATTNAPGLDDDGLPNDETAIAQDALGAREDGSQG
jgi:hypothetical protein